MANYGQWNEAIIRFHTRNIPKGALVYLTVSNETINLIGKAILGISGGDAAYDDFLKAVRETSIIVRQEQLEVCLEGLDGINEESGLPNGVAFLSLTVLAAHKMSSKDNIDHTNYFKRLRPLLGFGDEKSGRPDGFGVGQEEILWRSWGMWLNSHGWICTAEHGPEGPMKYINYPISQALLRDDDVEYLKGKFLERLREPKALRVLDESQLGGWLLRQRFNRKHLRLGFESSDPDRVSVFFDEAYKVYQGIDWEQSDAEGSSCNGWARSRKILAGILYQPSMKGGGTYRLMPRIPAQWQGERMVVSDQDGQEIPLEQYKAGLFRPLWPVPLFSGKAMVFKVDGSDHFDDIVLPARRFWILTPDPEDEYGALATWEKYSSLMGKKFLLIVEGGIKDPLAEQIMHFREHGKTGGGLGLIEWDRGPIDAGGWTEFHGCMILSASWDSIIPNDESIELYEALKPSLRANIALSGGLRVSGQGAWLEGYPPTVRIYGFEKEFKFRIVKGGDVLFEEFKNAQSSFSLDVCNEPGLYRLEVLWGQRVMAGKALRIISWEGLDVNTFDDNKWVDIGTAKISGPRVNAVKEALHG